MVFHPSAPLTMPPHPPAREGGQPIAAPCQPHLSMDDPWAPNAGRPSANPTGDANELTVVLPRRIGGFVDRVNPPPPPLAGVPNWPPAGYWPAPRGNPHRKWALIGGAAAAALTIALCVGVIIAAAGGSQPPPGTMTHTPSAPPPPTSATRVTPAPGPVVSIDLLPQLLPDPAVINTIEGATNIAVLLDPKAGNAFSDLPTDRPECQGIEHPALTATLQGSGWIAAQTQILRDPGSNWKHLVTNAVIDFTSAQAANDFAARQAQAWAKCNDKPLTSSAPGQEPITWSVGTTTNRNGMISVLLTQEGGSGWGCQRALTARNNIVVDTRSCGLNRTDQGLAIASKIAERVPTN